LAALRWHGYRSVLDVEESAIKELYELTAALIAEVTKMVGVPKPKP